MGIHLTEHNRKRSVNAKTVQICLIKCIFLLSSTAFFLFRAKSIHEYGESFYISVTEMTVGSGLFSIISNVTNVTLLFRKIDGLMQKSYVNIDFFLSFFFVLENWVTTILLTKLSLTLNKMKLNCFRYFRIERSNYTAVIPRNKRANGSNGRLGLFYVLPVNSTDNGAIRFTRHNWQLFHIEIGQRIIFSVCSDSVRTKRSDNVYYPSHIFPILFLFAKDCHST